MKTILLFTGFFMPLAVFAGTVQFEKTYGGVNNDYVHSVSPCPDEGFIVCGQTDSWGKGSHLKPDAVILKLDRSGNMEWYKTFGGSESDIAYSVQPISGKGYIVSGTTSSFGKGYPSMWIIRLNENGDSVWSRILEGDMVSVAHSVRQTTDSGFIIAGKGRENIIRLDKNGNKVWGKRHGWVFYAVEPAQDGGFIAVGDTIGKPGEWSYLPYVYILKTDGNGNKEWSHPLGDRFPGSATNIMQTSDGGYIISGDSIAIKSEYDHSHYAFAVKLDKADHVQWKYHGNEFSVFQSISPTGSGDFIAVGNTLDSEHGLNLLVTMIDKNGKEKWNKSYGNVSLWEYASSVSTTPDHGFIVGGQTESTGAGRYDMWILKLDANGDLNTTGTAGPLHGQTGKSIILQNYPNPFECSTTLAIWLPEQGYVAVKIYDSFGRLVSFPFLGYMPKGINRITWHPEKLKNGIYIVSLQQGTTVIKSGMVLLK